MKKMTAKMTKSPDTPNQSDTGLFDPGEWMNSRSFIKQLRKDNIDISLIQGELSELRKGHENLPWRRRLLSVFRSNQLQLFLSLLVLIDAFIVITEIVLEIHSMKSLKEAYQGQFSVAYGLLDSMFPRDDHKSLNDTVLMNSTLVSNSTEQSLGSKASQNDHDDDIFPLLRHIHQVLQNDDCSSIHEGAKAYFRRHKRISRQNVTASSAAVATSSPSPEVLQETASTSSGLILHVMRRSVGTGAYVSNSYHNQEDSFEVPEVKGASREYAHSLHDISQVLHYISIAILAFFLVEVFVKVLCLQRKFFREKFELVDAIVIVTSFVADIVFVQLASQEITVMVIFLLWRIVRVINGLLMHEKQRDEFRISLQKKARRLLETKFKLIQLDKEMLEKHVHLLEELCTELGASTDQISACRPRYIAHSKDQASHALKSIAALTTGFMGGLVGAQPYNNDKVTRFGSNQSTKRSLTSLKRLGGSRSSVKFENASLSQSQSTLAEEKVIGGAPASGNVGNCSSKAVTPHHFHAPHQPNKTEHSVVKHFHTPDSPTTSLFAAKLAGDLLDEGGSQQTTQSLDVTLNELSTMNEHDSRQSSEYHHQYHHNLIDEEEALHRTRHSSTNSGFNQTQVASSIDVHLRPNTATPTTSPSATDDVISKDSPQNDLLHSPKSSPHHRLLRQKRRAQQHAQQHPHHQHPQTSSHQQPPQPSQQRRRSSQRSSSSESRCVLANGNSKRSTNRQESEDGDPLVPSSEVTHLGSSHPPTAPHRTGMRCKESVL